MSDWYVIENGERVGPLSTAEIESGNSSGRFNADTPVWREGFADWRNAGDVPELSAILRPRNVPPPVSTFTPSAAATIATGPRVRRSTLKSLLQLAAILILLVVSISYKYRSGRHDKALQLYNGAVHWKRAGGSDSVALERYTQAIEADPDFAPPYLNRGVIRISHGDTAGGQADMQRVMEIARKHPPDADDSLGTEVIAKATFNEGLYRLSKRDTSAAFATFDSALKLQRKFSGPHLERGLILLARHDTGSAQEELLSAINQDEGIGDSIATGLSGLQGKAPTMDARRAHLILAILALAHHDEVAARSHLSSPGMNALPDAVGLMNALNRRN